MYAGLCAGCGGVEGRAGVVLLAGAVWCDGPSRNRAKACARGVRMPRRGDVRRNG